MNVSEPNGPQMGQIFFLYRISFLLNGIQSGLHVDGIPHNDSVRQQIQTSRLIGLAVLILLRHHPFTGKEEKFPQIMEFFAFVELGMDTPAQGFIIEIAQDENGFDEAPILLQQLGELALTRIGLEPTDEQRSRDVAAFERAGHTCQIVPSLQQPREVSPACEAGIETRVERADPFSACTAAGLPDARRRGENCIPNKSNRANTKSV